MEESVRLQYLEAMGIDVWVPRHRPVVAGQAVADPIAHRVALPDNEAASTPDHPVTGETAVNHQNVGWVENRDTQHPAADEYSQPGSPATSKATTVSATAGGEAIATPPPTHISLESTTGPALVSSPPHHPKPHTDDRAWKDLQHQVSICRACSLCETRTQTVFGVGNKHADWLLIGEAPGRDEDLQGEPFVGRAGQLLNEMIRAIGLRREQVYIANILKCRPPNNRDPQAGEVDACHSFLKRQIELIQPKLILAVGRIAAQNLLHTQQPLSRLRGMRHELEGIPLTVVHHPAYLLRSLPEKAKAWEDLQFALSVYQSLEQ